MPAPCLLGGEIASARFRRLHIWHPSVALRQLRYSLAAAHVVKGVSMISEIRIGVKENLVGFGPASFGTPLPATDPWRRSSFWRCHKGPFARRH